MSITAHEITESLMPWLEWKRKIIIPRYSPAKWWECDVFEITAAGYFREYEIKVSRSDFFNDAKKEATSSGTWNPLTLQYEGQETTNKHSLLASGSVDGPSRFYFVTPQNLLKLEELPRWAGLIEANEQLQEYDHRGVRLSRPIRKIRFKEIKAAPKLHGNKVNDAVRKNAVDTCYFRMHRYRVDLNHEIERNRDCQIPFVEVVL